MNFFAIFLDKEATKFVYACADVGGSSVWVLEGVYADLDVPTTRQ